MTTTAVALPQADADAGHRQILKVMTGLLAALFTAMLSTTIVSTALPTIMSDLNGTQRQYTWVITASLLAMTISTPIWGKLSDLFNKKFLVQLSIVLFVAGSVGAGLSQTVPPMMAFRALQGLAMGGLIALTQSIMGALIPPRQRGRYSGYMGAVMAVSTVSGPLLGGVISDNASWRWCFFVCVPLAVVALVLLQITLRSPAGRGHATIDYLGAVLIAVVAALPMLWVTFAGSDYAWISWQSGAFLAAFLVAVALAVVTELRASEPMVPIRLLGNRTTVLMIIASIAVGVAMFGSGTFLTQYFQLAGGHSATRAGLMTIPLIVAQMLVSTLGGQLVTRTGRWKPLMVVGSFALVAGLAALGTIDHATPYWQVGISMAVMGVGIGALIQNIVLAVQNTVDVRDIGSTSATITFFRSLGGAVGVAVLGAVLANDVASKVTSGLQAAGLPTTGGGGNSLDIKDLPAPVQAIVHVAYGDSFGLLFLIAAATSVVTLVAVLLVREVPLRTTVAMQPAAQAEGGSSPKPKPEPVAEHVPAFNQAALDDPTERLSVAALDVLTAAQDQARQHVSVSASSHSEVVAVLDSVGEQLDSLMADVHGRLNAIKARLAETDSGASLNSDGVGADSLRSYEYGLLLNSQQTADRVTRLARLEAERILTEADAELAVRQQRIETLRAAEAELSQRVGEKVKQG
jgi:EmrB/QacA subfamily drug resistance transporter